MNTVGRPLRIRRFPARGVLLGALLVTPLFTVPTDLQAQRTNVPDPETRMVWYENHVALAEASPYGALPWQFVGPTNISGRITDVAVVAPRGESYTIFVSAASGGVWRTQNEGVTWEPIFEEGPSTSIGDVTIAPSDPNIVWIGTGEANIFRSSMAGAGVYKSTDGGDSWTHMGLTGTQTVPRIVIHPTNPDIVYVAASGNEWTTSEDRGLYKSTDGGATWEKIHYVDEMTGAIDLVMHPEDPNTLYLATWQRVREKWNDPRNEPGYSGSGVYRSTDAGATWTAINEGLPAAEHRGRIGLDIARSNPDVIYAFVDNYEVAREAAEGELNAYGLPRGDVIKGASLFRSDDGGDSWRLSSQEGSYMENLSATYGWVFGQMRVDPNDENKVYVMGIRLNVSEDAGRTFRPLTGMHVDHHGLWIDPNNSDYLVNTNDGGVYISYDGGENWRNFYHNLPLVQFFNVNYDLSDPFRVYGSVQDHGSFTGVVDLSRGRLNIPAVEFDNAPGGEGSHHAVDPTDPAIVYSAGFYGRISRTNVETGDGETIVPEPEEGELAFRGQWLAPFIISPHNPRIIYHGMNYLFRSWNQGETWERISPDLSNNDRSQLGDISYQTITALSESPFQFGLIYAGTDDGRVHRTNDGGDNWTEIVDGLEPGKFTSRIVASAFDENTVYLSQNGKRDDDFTPYVWRSMDQGATWEDISANIPLGPVNVVREDPKNPNVLYVGTDVSAYVSIDGGASWDVLGEGLPSTFVSDIVIHPREDILVASTHGRGVWALDVRPLQQMSEEVSNASAHLFEVGSVELPQGGGGRGGFFGFGGVTVPVYYHLSQDVPVMILVKDAAGNTVQELEGTGETGLQRVDWTIGGRGGRGFGGGGAALRPGEYTISLTAGPMTSTVTVEVMN